MQVKWANRLKGAFALATASLLIAVLVSRHSLVELFGSTGAWLAMGALFAMFWLSVWMAQRSANIGKVGAGSSIKVRTRASSSRVRFIVGCLFFLCAMLFAFIRPDLSVRSWPFRYEWGDSIAATLFVIGLLNIWLGIRASHPVKQEGDPKLGNQ